MFQSGHSYFEHVHLADVQTRICLRPPRSKNSSLHRVTGIKQQCPISVKKCPTPDALPPPPTHTHTFVTPHVRSNRTVYHKIFLRSLNRNIRRSRSLAIYAHFLKLDQGALQIRPNYSSKFTYTRIAVSTVIHSASSV